MSNSNHAETLFLCAIAIIGGVIFASLEYIEKFLANYSFFLIVGGVIFYYIYHSFKADNKDKDDETNNRERQWLNIILKIVVYAQFVKETP